MSFINCYTEVEPIYLLLVFIIVTIIFNFELY